MEKDIVKESAKKLYTSKTFWTAIASIFTGIGMFVAGEQNVQELAMSVVGVIFLILRLITDKPVTLK